MTPADVLSEIDARLERRRAAGGPEPLIAGSRLLARRLDLGLPQALGAWVDLDARFARVTAAPDRRRFVLAAEDDAQARPALVLPAPTEDHADVADLLALDLSPGSGRFWRLTLACAVLREGPDVVRGRLLLRQDVHGWLRLLLTSRHARERRASEGAAAYAAVMGRAEAMGEDMAAARARADAARRMAAERWAPMAAEPPGALILDPAAFDWTRNGVLAGVDTIEILDAPAGGALGQALVRLNPRIGGPAGVPLIGLPADACTRKGRAA